MNNKPDIGLIDPHAERNSGTYDLHGVVQKCILDACPHRRGNACVIGTCRKSLLAEPSPVNSTVVFLLMQ